MVNNQSELKLRGESNGGRYSDQQRILYERLRDGRMGIESDNSLMAGRASWLIAASSVMFSASALIAGLMDEGRPSWFAAIVVVNVIAFMAMACFASSVWIPADSKVVGTNDVGHLYETYIDEDLDDALRLLMADESSVFERELTRNDEIACRISIMVYALDVQAILLASASVAAFLY